MDRFVIRSSKSTTTTTSSAPATKRSLQSTSTSSPAATTTSSAPASTRPRQSTSPPSPAATTTSSAPASTRPHQSTSPSSPAATTTSSAPASTRPRQSTSPPSPAATTTSSAPASTRPHQSTSPSSPAATTTSSAPASTRPRQSTSPPSPAATTTSSAPASTRPHQSTSPSSPAATTTSSAPASTRPHQSTSPSSPAATTTSSAPASTRPHQSTSPSSPAATTSSAPADTPSANELSSESDAEGPPSKKTKYTQKLRASWLKEPEFKEWLSLSGEQLTCKYCKCTLPPKVFCLKQHMKAKKHQAAVQCLINQSFIKVKVVRLDVNVQIAEGRLSLLVAQHTPISVVDHLTKTTQAVFVDSSIAANIQLCRTKCTAVIKNVWYPHFTKLLIDDIGDGPFSLIIDESTDNDVVKLLGIVIKYHSKTMKRVCGTFLKLQPLDAGDADSIVRALKSAVEMDFQLDLKKCVGIGTDNASVMVGRENGVYAKLKKEIPQLILVPCICHSLQLAISEVCKKFMPKELEFLIAETFNWFSNSPSRQLQYKQIYQTINDGHDPLKIVQSCKTRWLSIETAVTRILDQWIELELLFQCSRKEQACFTANILYNIFHNKVMKSYLIFLQPHLVAVQRVNKLFQGSSKTDMTKLMHDLMFLVEQTASVVTRQGFDLMASNIEDFLLPHPYLGYEFEEYLEAIKEDISPDEEAAIRNTCQTFLINLIKSLRARIPANIHILKQISALSVDNAVNRIKPSLRTILSQMNYSTEAIGAIERQWLQLPLVNWRNVQSTSEFWAEVYEYADAGGNNPFCDLIAFVKKMFVLPFSNAEVERTFSQMNIVKCKLRNRLQCNTVNAIVMIRSALQNMETCCYKYDIQRHMVAKIGTSEIYGNVSAEEVDVLDLM